MDNGMVVCQLSVVSEVELSQSSQVETEKPINPKKQDWIVIFKQNVILKRILVRFYVGSEFRNLSTAPYKVKLLCISVATEPIQPKVLNNIYWTDFWLRYGTLRRSKSSYKTLNPLKSFWVSMLNTSIDFGHIVAAAAKLFQSCVSTVDRL